MSKVLVINLLYKHTSAGLLDEGQPFFESSRMVISNIEKNLFKELRIQYSAKTPVSRNTQIPTILVLPIDVINDKDKTNTFNDIISFLKDNKFDVKSVFHSFEAYVAVQSDSDTLAIVDGTNEFIVLGNSFNNKYEIKRTLGENIVRKRTLEYIIDKAIKDAYIDVTDEDRNTLLEENESNIDEWILDLLSRNGTVRTSINIDGNEEGLATMNNRTYSNYIIGENGLYFQYINPLKNLNTEKKKFSGIVFLGKLFKGIISDYVKKDRRFTKDFKENISIIEHPYQDILRGACILGKKEIEKNILDPKSSEYHVIYQLATNGQELTIDNKAKAVGDLNDAVSIEALTSAVSNLRKQLKEDLSNFNVKIFNKLSIAKELSEDDSVYIRDEGRKTGLLDSQIEEVISQQQRVKFARIVEQEIPKLFKVKQDYNSISNNTKLRNYQSNLEIVNDFYSEEIDRIINHLQSKVDNLLKRIEETAVNSNGKLSNTQKSNFQREAREAGLSEQLVIQKINDLEKNYAALINTSTKNLKNEISDSIKAAIVGNKEIEQIERDIDAKYKKTANRLNFREYHKYIKDEYKKHFTNEVQQYENSILRNIDTWISQKIPALEIEQKIKDYQRKGFPIAESLLNKSPKFNEYKRTTTRSPIKPNNTDSASTENSNVSNSSSLKKIIGTIAAILIIVAAAVFFYNQGNDSIIDSPVESEVLIEFRKDINTSSTRDKLDNYRGFLSMQKNKVTISTDSLLAIRREYLAWVNLLDIIPVKAKNNLYGYKQRGKTTELDKWILDAKYSIAEQFGSDNRAGVEENGQSKFIYKDGKCALNCSED